jgi:protein TonB
MNRPNLILGAVVSITLIAGVAWYGQRTIYHPPLPVKPLPTPKPTDFVVNPEPVEVTEENSSKPRMKEDVVAPEIPDTPQPAKPDIFTVPVEPPQPIPFDPTVTKIPQGPRGPGSKTPVWDPGQLDRQPVASFRATPVYPQEMKRQGISGEVLVDFIVDPSGGVRNPIAAHSSQRDFEEPACRAVAKWRFTPGMKGGHAVFVHMQVPIVFTLSDGS